MATKVKPSDVVSSAADEIGECMAIVRAKAINATGQTRDELFAAYDELLTSLQDLVRRDLKEIDADPRVKGSVGELSMFTQGLAKVKREMRTAKTVIDRVRQVVGWADKILELIAS
jgi:hypothetical protein